MVLSGIDDWLVASRLVTDGGSDEPRIFAAGDGPSEPEQFRRQAEQVADDWDAVDLDFTVDSLTRLDEYAANEDSLVETLAGEDASDTAELGYAVDFGSYFGEVLVRAFDADWTESGEGWTAAVPLEDGVVEVAVFDVAATSFTEEPVFTDVVEELRAERE